MREERRLCFDDDDPWLPPLLFQAFLRALANCKESKSAFEHQQALFLLTEKLKTIMVCHYDGRRAQELIETAYEVLEDLGFEHSLACTLPAQALADWDLDAAEAWLALADPEAPELELDNDYRRIRGRLLLARERYEEVLDLVGRSRVEIPVEQPQVPAIHALRIAALWQLSRKDEAEKALVQMLAIIDDDDKEAARELYDGDALWEPVKETWDRMDEWEPPRTSGYSPLLIVVTLVGLGSVLVVVCGGVLLSMAQVAMSFLQSMAPSP